MGVPKYFMHIMKSYGSELILRHFSEVNMATGGLPVEIYFDLNCCIHSCVQQAEKAYPLDVFGQERLETEIIRVVIDYMEYMIHLVDENLRLIYIAVDGVCPVGKMKQQRCRRYKSAWEKAEKLRIMIENGVENPDLGKWDTAAITPGTNFMNKLADSLAKWKKRILDDEKHPYNRVRIIISDSNQPGEGEHKIFTFIQRELGDIAWNPDIDNTNEITRIIYGLDADLILLSMLNIRDGVHCYLMREEQHFGNFASGNGKKSKKNSHATATVSATELQHLFLYFDVTKFRNIIITQLGKSIDTQYQRYMATAEYVFLCSLMGNDFVPASSLLRIADEGIENIIEIYHTIVTIDKYILSHKQDFITNTHTIDINFEFLEQIMLTLAIDERQNGIRLEEEMQKRFFRPNQDMSQVDIALRLWSIQCQKMFPGINWEDDINWKYDYYIHGFSECNLKFNTPDNREIAIRQIRKICRQYIESLVWCINYYHGNCLSWSWYYPYHEPPLWSDIAGGLRSLINRDKLCDSLEHTIGDHQPWKPIEQLAYVLGKHSHHLLPHTSLHNISNILSRKFGYLWVDSAPLHVFYSFQMWECEPILPECHNLREFRHEINRIISKNKS